MNKIKYINESLKNQIDILNKHICIIYYLNVVFFLLLLHGDISLNAQIFFGSILAFIFCLTFQIIYTPKNTVHILAQLIIFRYLLQMIFVVPVEGLFGYDTMPYLKSAELFYLYGFNIPHGLDSFGIANSINSWPGLSIFALSIESLSGLELFSVAKYVPSITSSFGIIFIFLISKQISKSNQIAFLVVFMSMSVIQYVEFHSWFVREFLAFIYFLITVYLIKKKIILNSKFEISVLYILVLGAITITHHFVSLILIIYIAIIAFHKYILCKSMQQNVNFNTILFLTTVLIICYWMYFGKMPFVLLSNFLGDIINQSLNFQSANDLGGDYVNRFSLRRFIIVNGNIFFVIFFGLVSFISILKKSSTIKIINFTFILSLFLVFSLSLIFPDRIHIIPDRVYMYAWPFVFVTAFDLYNMMKTKYKYVLLIISLLFVVFNIWSIAPYIYLDDSQPEYEFNQVDYRQSNIHYSSIYWINHSYTLQATDIIIGSSTAKDLIQPMLNVFVSSNPQLLAEGMITTNFNILYFDTEMFEIIRGVRGSPNYKVPHAVYNIYNNNVELYKNYDNGRIEIYTHMLTS